MPDIEMLNKQLRGIRTTRKLTKAMKTISTVKFSKLKSVYGEYSPYGKECARILKMYGEELGKAISSEVNENAPPAFVVMASNRGLCGKFNSDVLNFAKDKIEKYDEFYLVACSKKAVNYFNNKGIPISKERILSDVPSFEETSELLQEIINLRNEGRISKVYVIYSEYCNMVEQRPRLKELFFSENAQENGSVFCVPDRITFVQETAQTVFRAVFYELALEAAMGAQGSTLMTMRSAYDTATEYCEQLEAEINRIRQSVVTADVIETSAERKE